MTDKAKQLGELSYHPNPNAPTGDSISIRLEIASRVLANLVTDSTAHATAKDMKIDSGKALAMLALTHTDALLEEYVKEPKP